MKEVVLLIILFGSIQSFGQLIQDESHVEKDFWKFKVKLENSIINKNIDDLKECLADTIFESKDICGYPGCSKSDFIKYYFEYNAKSNWQMMLQIVRFGFYRTEMLHSPSRILSGQVFFQAPSYLKSIDGGVETIILGENVNIRAKPSLKAKVIRQASFEKFKCDCNILDVKESTFQKADGIDWLEIYIDENTVGYVAIKYTSYSIHKEITITKVKGEWKVISYFSPPGC